MQPVQGCYAFKALVAPPLCVIIGVGYPYTGKNDMKNIKIVPSKKVEGRVSLQVDLTKKGELSETGRARKIAFTNKFETVEINGEEYGIMVMLTKKVPTKKKAK